ncbi:uncharacterized protein LOC123864655 [Maniola jurtina]|uniref:uncharacterized protein LOC123864655 n=1 Tax=Maniola jurtina TaxID=191418 RepID=UPI001E68A7BA|nr:uncharacterized protein LOC123864655 [Maniola jurtina]
MTRTILLACVLCLTAQSLAISDDKFIKKYAMMKIYESCFGPEVVKQLRQEMKDAVAKCCAAPPLDEPSNDLPNEPPNQQSLPSILFGKLPPGFAMDPSTQTITKPLDGAHGQENSLPQPDQGQPLQRVPPIGNMLPFRSQGPFQPPSPYPMPGQYRPLASPYYQFPYNPMLYSPPGLQYNPYAYQQQPFQQQPFQQGMYQTPYFAASSRMSRDFNMHRDDQRDRLELLNNRYSTLGRVRNITCVMQELGYVDHNMQPNYEQITQRISNLPVSTELKGDIQDGMQFCQKFSQCVPDIKRDMAPLSQELIKPMFFFRCYKHKKLEACIMKDIRERFTSEDELDTEGDFRSLSRSARSLKDDPLGDPRLEALDEMSAYMFDYLSGGSSLDYDLYL